MRTLFKILSYFLLLIISLVICLVIILNTFYSDKIEKSVMKNLKSQLISKIDLSSVTFSLWEHFPYASVNFNDIIVYESNASGQDTLLFSKEAHVNLSLFDIALKNYKIKKVYIKDGIVNMKYNTLDSANFLISKIENDSSKSNISIEEVILINTKIDYLRPKTKTYINCNIEQGIIEIKNNIVEFNTTVFSENLNVNKINFLKNKKYSVKSSIEITGDTLNINKSNILIDDVLLKLNGFIIYNKIVNLNIDAKNQQLNSIIENLPEKIKKTTNSFITNGLINANATVSKEIGKKTNPNFSMDFKIRNGSFKLKSVPFILKEITTSGDVNNGGCNCFESSIINFKDFYANTNNGSVRGDFTVKNFNNYFLYADFNSSWDLTELNRYFQDSPFIDLQGRLNAVTSYKGNLAFNKNFQDYFIDSKHQSKFTLNDVKLTHIHSNREFEIFTADCNIENNVITLQKSNAFTSNSNIQFDGKIKNLFRFMLNKHDKIEVTGNLNSTKLFLKELMSTNNQQQQSKTVLPEWLSLKINTNINNFNYNKFNALTLTGILQYDKQKLKGSDLKLKSLDGEIAGDFILREPTNKYLILNTNVNLKKINIRKSFESFNNFNQTFIRQNELNGIGTIELDIESHWKPSFILNKDRLSIKSHLIIEQGELIDFKPLENLSTFVSLDDLKHVRFSTLENTIEVSNQIVTIPAMEIKSTALSVFLSGTHTFKQEINYNIKLLLSELLSNRFRKENTSIKNEFGEIKEDQNFSTIYLKMTGKTENPKISFDKIKIQEDIKQNINEEVEIISDIIKEDITKVKEKKEKGDDVLIEWEEERKYVPK